jgi:hypothetical protein
VILAAGLLVLLGLGLFVGGVLTGTTAFYWGCVAVCVAAAVLLYLARRRISAAEASATGPAAVATASGATASGATASSEPAVAAPAAAEATPAAEERAPREPAHSAPPSTGAPTGSVATDEFGDPPIEDVEVTDLLLVVDLKDEVLVVDEHPRYHLAGCPHLRGRTTIPLPLDEARTDGFTPCATCAPDRNLAERERARKHAAGN